MAYIRKTVDQWHVQCNYGFGQGFETITIEESCKEARKTRKLYQENLPQDGAYRVIKKREKLNIN